MRAPKFRVAFAGLDFFGSCLTLLIESPHCEVVGLATPSCEDSRSFMVQDWASRLGVPLLSGKPNVDWVAELSALEVDLLVVAAYRWRIPIESVAIPFALNVHPSMLPLGRGPNPLPHFFLGESRACGVTIHQLSPQFDEGPILAQTPVDANGKAVDEVYLEIVGESSKLLACILQDIPGAFERAQPQLGESSWLPELDWEARSFLAQSASVGEISDLNRVFGLFGLSAVFPDGGRQEVVMRRVVKMEHGRKPGKFLQWSESRGVLALTDGLAYVSLRSTL